MIDSHGCLQALFPIFDTFYLVINATPTLLPHKRRCPPTSCLWPILTALPLLAMCWESKGSPPIAHQKRTPPSPAPCPKSQSIAWQTEMDWDVRDPLPSRDPRLPPSTTGPPKSCCHWRIIAVIFGRMCGSSLLPLEGSYHKGVDGHSFLFRNNGHNVQQHVWQTPEKALLTAKKMT